MKVIVYEPEYDEKHRRVLRAFAAGIPGAKVRPVTRYEPCDVAVIFGLVKASYSKTWSKARILKRHSGRSLIVIESAFARRGEYWAIGFGGIAGHADFRSEGVPLDRFAGMGIEVKPWRDRPDGWIVVCGQLRRDTSVQDTDHVGWCRKAVRHFRAMGLPVRFRPHPKEKDPAVYGIDPALWDRRPLAESLDEARCVVTFNSTTGTDAALAGVPVVACDRGSFAWPVASHSLTEEAAWKDRDRWLAGLGYAQWTLEEMRAGLPWKHLTRP